MKILMHQLDRPLSQRFRSQPIKRHQLTRTCSSFPTLPSENIPLAGTA
ncbi:MAG: hypothetical protein ACKOQS_30050 [Dolichospermum sp.]